MIVCVCNAIREKEFGPLHGKARAHPVKLMLLSAAARVAGSAFPLLATSSRTSTAADRARFLRFPFRRLRVNLIFQ